MDRRLSLVRQFEDCAETQRRYSPLIREFKAYDLPLLAEWYVNECKRLGEIMLQCIDELKAMDEAQKQGFSAK